MPCWINPNSKGQVIVPNETTSVPNNAFGNCIKLKTIEFPKKSLTEIRRRAFEGCVNLDPSSFNLPESLTEIEEGAFYNTPIHGVVDGWLIRNSPEKCFSDTYMEEHSVKRLSDASFYPGPGCSNRTSIAFPNSMEIVEWRGQFRSNVQQITFGNNTHTIRGWFGKTKLKDVVLPDSVKTLWRNSFIYMPTLHTVHIGNGLATIPDYSFTTFRNYYDKNGYLATNLHSVTIGSGVTTIGVSAFQGHDLSVLKVGPVEHFGRNSFSSFKTCVCGHPNLLQRDFNMTCEEYVKECAAGKIPNRYVEEFVGPYIYPAVYNHSGRFVTPTNRLKYLLIPDDTKIIGERAFYGAAIDSSTAHLGKNVVEYGKGSFKNNFFTNLTLSERTRIVHEEAFMSVVGKTTCQGGCFVTDDEELNVWAPDDYPFVCPTDLEIVKRRAFFNVGISHLILNKRLRHLGEESFGQNRITRILIPWVNSLEFIHEYAFRGNKGLLCDVECSNGKVVTNYVAASAGGCTLDQIDVVRDQRCSLSSRGDTVATGSVRMDNTTGKRFNNRNDLSVQFNSTHFSFNRMTGTTGGITGYKLHFMYDTEMQLVFILCAVGFILIGLAKVFGQGISLYKVCKKNSKKELPNGKQKTKKVNSRNKIHPERDFYRV
eukprot:g1764.t1